MILIQAPQVRVFLFETLFHAKDAEKPGSLNCLPHTLLFFDCCVQYFMPGVWIATAAYYKAF